MKSEIRRELMVDYLKHPALGSSDLKKILETPFDYRYNRDLLLRERSNQTVSEEPSSLTAASGQLFGELLHLCLLEPAQFATRYVLQPEDWGALNKNPGRQKWVQLQQDNPGKICVKHCVAQELRAAIAATRRNTLLSQTLESLQEIELSAYATVNGIDLKARVDSIGADGYVYELKTTTEGMDDFAIARTLRKYRYAFQRAHHLTTFGAAAPGLIKGHRWVFLSTNAPYHARIVEDHYLAEIGEREFYEALEAVAICEQSGMWPGYPDFSDLSHIHQRGNMQ